MDKVIEFFNSIWNLKADQITIISLLITLFIFVMGKFSENRIKEAVGLTGIQKSSRYVRSGIPHA